MRILYKIGGKIMFLKDLFKKRRRCNHDLKDENTTLRRLSKMNMVFPPQKNYICEECKKIFSFKD